jgi:glutathione S-transferase
MKLYSAPLSLFARKVEIALAEKGIAFERVMAPFSQTSGYRPKLPEVLAVNPKGQVPVLVDGPVDLYDSTVILEYLEDAYPSPPLLPASPAERAACRLFELYADEIMLVPLKALMHRTTPDALEAPGWEEAEQRAREAEAIIAEQYTHLETRLGDDAFFCSRFGVADIALHMGVLFGQRLAGPSLAGFPRLHAWMMRLLERPAFASVLTEMQAADKVLSRPIPGAYAGISSSNR